MKKALLLILAVSLLPACTTSPTGRSQLMLISPDAAIVESKKAYLSTVNELDKAAKLALELPNSRTAESEADRIGMELAVRAGYDPDAAVTLWQKMGSLGGSKPPAFLSTHPAPGNREAALAQMVPAMRKLNPSGTLAAMHPVQIVR